MTEPKLYPRLIVDDAAEALSFYTEALGATELVRFPEPSGRIVHAEVRIGESVFSVAESDGGHNLSPASLGGSGLLLTLVVDDADAVGASLEGAGAEVVIPIADQYYGRREGRLRDPFGHLWIISQDGEDLDEDEIRRRVDEAADRNA
ncbi:MAG: VOC family protein [Actinomycetota bacterium]